MERQDRNTTPSAFRKRCFSGDGLHAMYIATRKGKEVLVVDGKEALECQRVDNPMINADGSHVAYLAQPMDASSPPKLVLDGVERTEFRDTYLSEPESARSLIARFSPAGGHVAYLSKKLNAQGRLDGYTMVVDGNSSKLYSTDRAKRDQFHLRRPALALCRAGGNKFVGIRHGAGCHAVKTSPSHDRRFPALLFSPRKRSLQGMWQ